MWWDHGDPGHHAHLHVALAVQREVVKYLFPLETVVHHAPTLNSDEDALETMPYAAQQKVTGFSKTSHFLPVLV